MCAVSYKHAACSIAISALIYNNPTFYRVLGVLAFNNPTCCSAFIFRKATFSCIYRALTSKTPAFFLTFSALIFKHATFFSIFDAFIFQNATFPVLLVYFSKIPFFQYVLCTHLKHATFSSIFSAFRAFHLSRHALATYFDLLQSRPWLVPFFQCFDAFFSKIPCFPALIFKHATFSSIFSACFPKSTKIPHHRAFHLSRQPPIHMYRPRSGKCTRTLQIQKLILGTRPKMTDTENNSRNPPTKLQIQKLMAKKPHQELQIQKLIRKTRISVSVFFN